MSTINGMTLRAELANSITNYGPRQTWKELRFLFYLLERVTQITLALHQVAENTLLYEVPRRVNKYCLDPDWQLLLLMEDNCDPRRIVAAFKSRLTKASRRVKRLFSLQRLSFLAT